MRRRRLSGTQFSLKRSEFRPAELNFAFKALLILMNPISKSMFACFKLDISPSN